MLRSDAFSLFGAYRVMPVEVIDLFFVGFQVCLDVIVIWGL